MASITDQSADKLLWGDFMSIVTVSSTAALTSAVNAAHDGDTILLKAGEYDGLALKNLTFAQGITITSADPTHEAVLSNFGLTRVQGVTFSNVELLATGGATTGYAFDIEKSGHITFDHVYAHGSLDGDSSNDAGGILLQFTNNIKVTNSEFTQLRQAVAVVNADNVVISNDYAHDLMKTGFVLSGASDVQITHNTISSIKAVNGEHPDAIQFFTTGTTTAAHDINISDNVILRGSGDFTQGIFLRDQVGTLPYQNVTITNNLVDGTGYGGVYVQGANGLTISGNDLVSIPGKINATFLRVENGQNVTVTNNQGYEINFDANTHPTLSGNVNNGIAMDGGAGAMNSWYVIHPDAGSTLASHSPTPNLPMLEPIATEGFAPQMASTFMADFQVI
jgi:parallel beta-helix repeat protein